MGSQGKNKLGSAARVRSRHRVVAWAISAGAAIALASAIVWYHGAQSIAHGYEPGVAAITLDPQAFAGEARETYRIARDRPGLLAELYCYCKCDTRLGHRSLLDCYRDPHAASCGICLGEARDTDQVAKRGVSIDEIRGTLRARYENSE